MGDRPTSRIDVEDFEPTVVGEFDEVFSARPVLDQIANKWSVLVLTVLCQQPSRFNAIRRRLGAISHKALTEALRRLERSGLVNRTVHDSSPVAVEYSITPLGRSLQGPFEALYAWAGDNADAVAAAQSSYDREAEGDGGVRQS